MNDKTAAERVMTIKEDYFPSLPRRMYNVIREWLWAVRRKKCGFCKHFQYFHGSAGLCDKSCGCLNRDFRDFFDECDRRKFRPLPPWSK